MAIDPDEFILHLETLQNIGTFISWDEVCQPSRREGLSFALSFDDGYRDNRTVLLPILERMNIPVAIFICGGVADGSLTTLPHDQRVGFEPALLSPDDIRELAAHPLITLGCHTHTHPRLSDLDEADVLREVKTGKSALEEVSGMRSTHFAVPFGQRGDADWSELLAHGTTLGLRSVASNFGGWTSPPERMAQDTIHVKRVSMGPISDPDVVRGWVLRHAVCPSK